MADEQSFDLQENADFNTLSNSSSGKKFKNEDLFGK